MDSVVLGFQKTVQLSHEFVEYLGVLFLANARANPVQPFTFFGFHGGASLLTTQTACQCDYIRW